MKLFGFIYIWKNQKIIMFLTECPRDAMQSWGEFIPTNKKIDYINSLMDVGFDILDCLSFTSPKEIPQMADSDEVADNIDKSSSNTKVSAIIGNYKAAEQALRHQSVDILRAQFSISETFQYRSSNKSQKEAFNEIIKILELVKREEKQLNIYFSMTFGNPYGEMWKWENVDYWTQQFLDIGVKHFLLSDTIGLATPEKISFLFEKISCKYPDISFGGHFRNRYKDFYLKLKAAYNKGCRGFDSTIKGIGGSPIAQDDLVGNIPTEQVINFMIVKKVDHKLNFLNFEGSYNKSKDIFHF